MHLPTKSKSMKHLASQSDYTGSLELAKTGYLVISRFFLQTYPYHNFRDPWNQNRSSNHHLSKVLGNKTNKNNSYIFHLLLDYTCALCLQETALPAFTAHVEKKAWELSRKRMCSCSQEPCPQSPRLWVIAERIMPNSVSTKAKVRWKTTHCRRHCKAGASWALHPWCS